MAISAEALLISSVLREGDFKTAIKQGLTLDMFHGYAEEWAWLERYYQRHRKSPTKVAFKNHFPEFVVKAVNDTGHFADEVRRAHARHTLTGGMREIADLIADGDIAAATEKGSRLMIAVAAGLGHADDGDILTSHEDIMADIAARRDRFEENGSAGITTGFITLDERTGGAQPGELWVWGARLGEGKSWTLQKMAAAAVMMGHTVQFDALEQSRSQVAMRIYSMLSGQMGKQLFNSMSLMQGKDYDPRDFRKFVRSLKNEVKGRLHVSDASRGKVSTMTIASQIERNKADVVFVDYITLLAKKSSEWQGVAELSSELVQLTTEYGIPIHAASQLNREYGIGKKGVVPGPEALAQADAIGQDATAIINMAAMSPSVRVMQAVKMRNAVGGFKWYNHFNPGIGKFEEVTFEQAKRIADADADKADEESM